MKEGIKGKRVYPDDDGHLRLPPGGYGKHPKTGEWLARPPSCHTGNLKDHAIEENKSGTITAWPSIRIGAGDGGGYHGYLRDGIWYEC